MSNEMIKKGETQLQEKKPTASERFTNMVVNEFQGNIGQLNLNEYQKQLINNYHNRYMDNQVYPKVGKERFWL